MKKPVIAIPIGDPAGVGPEIVAKSIASDEVFQIAVCVIVGDRKIVEKAIEITGENLKINEIKEPEEAVDEKGVLNLINLDNVDMDTFAYGKVSAMCGKAAYEYIAKSIELANAGKVDAVATTPINKESLHAAEVPYIGHTEIFGALTHTEDPLTMFETNGMRVFFLTRHVSLRQMLDMIKKDRIIDYVKRCTKALERLGVKEGTMAIAGLNPHSGEHGLFGWEEVEEIMPAIEELKAEGYDVAGPIGADSVFLSHRTVRKAFHNRLFLFFCFCHKSAVGQCSDYLCLKIICQLIYLFFFSRYIPAVQNNSAKGSISTILKVLYRHRNIGSCMDRHIFS